MPICSCRIKASIVKVNIYCRKLISFHFIALVYLVAPHAQDLPEELVIHDDGASRTFEFPEVRQASGDHVVLYEKGVRRTEASRRLLTRRVHVHLSANVDPQALAREFGATSGDELSYAPGHFIFKTASPRESWRLAETLRQKEGVISADPILARKRSLRFVPDDPLFGYQWHLLNDGQNGATPGTDINVTRVWDTYRGREVYLRRTEIAFPFPASAVLWFAQ